MGADMEKFGTYRTYLKATAVVALTGYSKRKVERDSQRFQWPYTRTRNSPIRLYDMTAIENSYGIKFQSSRVSMIAGKLNKLAVYREFSE